MDECDVDHCNKPAAIILPTICEDVRLCVQHAQGIVTELIPGQRQRQDVTVTP